MTDIIWDEIEKRLYEIGIDHGVLYLVDSVGIPWNGLVSIEEIFDEVKFTTYLDGVKVFDIYSSGDFQATLKAFTYPDEFLIYQGVETFDNSGLTVTGQDALTFNLSYRTLVGNDVSGTEYGYQIHLLYNLMAVAQDIDYNTHSLSPDISDFSWNIIGTPERVDQFQPTAHVIINSQYISIIPYLLVWLEDILYGTDTTIACLPPLNSLMFVVPYFEALTLIPNFETGLSSFISGYNEFSRTKVDGLLVNLPRSRLSPSTTDGFYTFQ